MQTKLRTNEITPNNNICFPIGTILAVQKQYENLGFNRILSKYKKKGRDLNLLLMALLSYKLTENFSISKASKWINRKEVLDIFNLDGFEERTLFRTLETIGENREEIIADIQDNLFQKYEFDHTNINLDWTSLILFEDKSILGKYGYSRDHRPDKKQVTVGISELADPINVPVGITVKKGNVPDITHFADTYLQIKSKLEEGSRITFDKGGHSKDNIKLVLADKMKYLTAKKLNKSDDKRIKEFDRSKAELIDEEEELKLVQSAVITGREGFFCLKSNENLTLEQALQTYRKKGSIEKIMHSLKNEIEIKPLRVWSEHSIYGALVIGFIAQLFISLMRYELNELKHISTKFIKNSLMNLTVTVDYMKNGVKKFIYANFDQINTLILRQRHGIS